MARKRKFDVSGINIRVHTKHAPAEYRELWVQMHNRRRYITYASNAFMIGDVRYENKDNPAARLYGYFYRFLDVDPDNPWFNINKHKRATEEDVEHVVIPPELKPDLVEIPYVFDVARHCLYFVSHDADANLSPKLVHKLLTFLAGGEAIAKRFGVVDLTVLSDRGKVEDMLNWPVIRSLKIEVDRPNPSEEEDEAAFYERLKKRGLASETRLYKKADDATSVVPDEEMRSLAHVAANNGVVEVSGVSPQRVSGKASSNDFPLRLKGLYDPDLKTRMDALKGLVNGLGQK